MEPFLKSLNDLDHWDLGREVQLSLLNGDRSTGKLELVIHAEHQIVVTIGNARHTFHSPTRQEIRFLEPKRPAQGD